MNAATEDALFAGLGGGAPSTVTSTGGALSPLAKTVVEVVEETSIVVVTEEAFAEVIAATEDASVIGVVATGAERITVNGDRHHRRCVLNSREHQSRTPIIRPGMGHKCQGCIPGRAHRSYNCSLVRDRGELVVHHQFWTC